ncbi:MAG: NUDIX domain-containing protein [Myxococcota bacterium]
MSAIRARQAVRGLFIDPTGALLLLFTGSRRGDRFWLTPGGGIEGGESTFDALARELREEVGYTLEALPEEVWSRTFDYVSSRGPARQSERYFLIQTRRFEPSFDFLPTEEERQEILDWRWWTEAQIRAAANERFAPAALPDLLAEVTGRLSLP